MSAVQWRQAVVEVRGIPAAQGSKSAIPYHRANGKLGVRVVDPADRAVKIRSWRADVRDSALAAIRADADWPGPLDGPLAAVIHFTVAPVKLPRRVRWHGVLVPAVHWPWKRPDLDKYVRATFDALTSAGVWHDDAQVVTLTASKSYPGSTPHSLPVPGAWITVTELPTFEPAGVLLPLAAAATAPAIAGEIPLF